MNEVFLPKLNAFIELLKETKQIHIDHLLKTTDWQKALLAEHKVLNQWLETQVHTEAIIDHPQFRQLMQDYTTYAADFEKSVKGFGAVFRQHIEDTNLQLGMFSTHWGGYIEGLGVHYMLNSLRKEQGVHTSFQKFKRFWHKSSNVEIDLLAVSDTHAYVVEVKNQLKPETFIQMLKILDKIKDKVPEYAHLKLQPVFVCVHADEQVVRSTVMSGLWIVRYKGFDRSNAIDSFEWLRKDEG